MAYEQLLSSGHRAARSRGMCFVRAEKHPLPHYLQRATLCLSLSGRTWAWPLTSSFLKQQTYPHDLTDLIVLDTSQNDAFGAQIQRWLAQCGYRTHTYLRDTVGPVGIADLPRSQATDAVRNACVQIYNHLRSHCTAPIALFLEDDVVPPPDAYIRLAALLREGVVSASGFYRHRGSGKPVAWDWNEQGFPSFPEEGKGVTTIGGTGFGCLAARGDVVREYQFHREHQIPNYDQVFFRDMVLRGPWKAFIDWSCVCRHYVSAETWI